MPSNIKYTVIAGKNKIENRAVTIIVPAIFNFSRNLNTKSGYNKMLNLLNSALLKHITIITNVATMLNKNQKINKQSNTIVTSKIYYII